MRFLSPGGAEAARLHCQILSTQSNHLLGYGDRYPVTNAGRAVAVLVMIAGVGLFGTLSGFLANFFLAPPAPREAEAPAGERAPADPKERIADLKQMLEAQERTNANLRAKLDEIDALF